MPLCDSFNQNSEIKKGCYTVNIESISSVGPSSKMFRSDKGQTLETLRLVST